MGCILIFIDETPVRVLNLISVYLKNVPWRVHFGTFSNSRFSLSTLQQMAVRVRSNGEVTVSEPVLYHLYRDACRNHQAGLCVSQIV